ncbi:MAG TPA: hypothetical protein VH740_01575 [Vicinamibacterales bacterium]
MRVASVLRAIAVAMAVAAIVDPSLNRTTLAPVPVEVVLDPAASASNELRALTEDVERRLRRDLESNAVINSDASPAAAILVGSRATPPEGSGRLSISTVNVDAVSPPNARIISVDDPPRALVGWIVDLKATVEARGLAGTISSIVLEEQGTEIATLERKWTSDNERADVTLPYVPPREGVSRLTLRVRSIDGERRVDDNTADVSVAASGRRLRVLAYEPRPSWGAAFVRRALEDNATFDVSTLVRSSRGIAVRAGTPPAVLTADSLSAYDAVLVSAPEDLTAAEVDALESFARVRGGTVVCLPDRRPSGRYVGLMGKIDFEEVLVDRPLSSSAASGGVLRASELAVPRQELPDADVLAAVDLKNGPRPLVLSRAIGAGAVIFSGALDAWRYRDSPDDGFSRFWQTSIADAALGAPARIEIQLDPSVASPGQEVIVRARLRRTEMRELADRTVIPPVSARIVGPKSIDESIRLWPAAERGMFEGRMHAPQPGRYDVRVATTTATADAVLLSAGDARSSPAVRSAERRASLLAAATGGVVVTPDDLGPLERHVRGLPRPETRVPFHPARSAWFVILFAALLSIEWLTRRKHGLA